MKTCAALTALNKSAVQAVETCAALTALNKSAVQAVEGALAERDMCESQAGRIVLPDC